MGRAELLNNKLNSNTNGKLPLVVLILILAPTLLLNQSFGLGGMLRTWVDYKHACWYSSLLFILVPTL
jgi:hypothetical protein